MTTSNNKAIITGINGYIGANLARRLLQNSWEVHGIIRAHSNTNYLETITEQLNGKTLTLHTYYGEIEELINIFNSTNAQAVFHLASLYITEHKRKDINALIESNVLFGTQVCEAMTQSGIPYLVNTGTSWQHYENSNYCPVNLYAATKQAFEDIMSYYIEARGLTGVTLKLFDTYGENDPRPKLLNLLKDVIQTRSSIDMSPGEQFVDLVYIDDVIDAYLIAFDNILNNKYVSGTTYAVSSGQPIKLRALVDLIEKTTGVTPNINWGKRPYRNREVMIPWNTGPSLIGWQPNTNLETGIRRCFSSKSQIS